MTAAELNWIAWQSLVICCCLLARFGLPFGSLSRKQKICINIVTVHVCFLYHGIGFCDGDVFFFYLLLFLNIMFLFRIYLSVRSTPRWILTLTSWRSNLIPDIPAHGSRPDRPSTPWCWRFDSGAEPLPIQFHRVYRCTKERSRRLPSHRWYP